LRHGTLVWLVTLALLLRATAPLGVHATASATSVPTGATALGGLNLGRYCHSLGDTSASLDGITASDWHCVDS
jgi:hypothetical protein